MRLAILSLVTLFALGAQGQYTTDHVVDTWSDGTILTDQRTFDADTDGDQDIFVKRTGNGGASIIWYRNNGAGNFATAVTLAGTTGCCGNEIFPVDFDVHDVDGDGDRDLVFGRNSSNDLFVRRLEPGGFGPEEIWGTLAFRPDHLRFLDLPSIQTWWLIAHGTSGQPHAFYPTGSTFTEYNLNGNGVDLTGVNNIETGHISGYAGDIVVQTADRLILYIIQDGQGDNHGWFDYDLGYCDDRIQVADIDGYTGDEIGRTNTDTTYYTNIYYDIDVGMTHDTYVIDINNAGYGWFGRADCDDRIDLYVHRTDGGNGNEPFAFYGYNDDGFDFGPATASTGTTLSGAFPVLVDMDGNALNDLLETVDGNSLHWYTNGGPAPLPVSLPPYQPLANCENDFALFWGTPSGGFFTGPLVYPTSEFGEFVDRENQPPGAYPITYNVYDNNGCLGTATQYLQLIDSVTTIPASLTTCASNTPVQFTTDPTGAFWLSDNYITSDGILDISFPFETDLLCFWTDVTECGVYGLAHAQVLDSQSGYVYLSCTCDNVFCSADPAFTITRSLPDGTSTDTLFDPGNAAPGFYTFVGYPDLSAQVTCFVNDTLLLEVRTSPTVTLELFPDTLVNSCNLPYVLSGGYPLPADTSFAFYHDFGVEYQSGPPSYHVFHPEQGQLGPNSITYHFDDWSTGCSAEATQYIYVIDQVGTVPDSLTACPSNTPYQLGSIPANAVWTDDNLVTPDGLLDISSTYATTLQCIWTDVLGCEAFGSMPVIIEPGETGEAYISNWQGPDILCTNSDPVEIYRTVGDGTFELIPFDPAIAGTGFYTFIGYPDTSVPAECYANDTLVLQVLPPPTVALEPFLDTLANTCNSGYVLQGGAPSDSYNYYEGAGVEFVFGEPGYHVFNALYLVGDIPITYTYFDPISGCSNSATQPITVIDSVVVVPTPLITCPQPDSIQVLTYPNAVWGSNEIPGGLVDVSYPYQQHYLCYWTDVVGCGVWGELDVIVAQPNLGYAYASCECTTLCTNSDPVTITQSTADGDYDEFTFDPAVAVPGVYQFVGYGFNNGPFSCAVNDTLFLLVADPPNVSLSPFTDTLVTSCQNSSYPFSGGSPAGGLYTVGGIDDPAFFPFGLQGQASIEYTYTDAGTGCSSTAIQYITLIDSVVVQPDSVRLCRNGPGAQFTTIPANAVWASDYVTPAGTVLTDQGYTGYAPCYFTDVLGCQAPGTGYVDIEYPNYGYAYVNDGYDDDIICLNEPPTTVTYTLANGTYETIDFDPAVYGIGSFQFIGFGDVSEFDCAINDTLIVQVVAPPNVTLAAFADTLVSGCQNSTYPLTGGLPTGGYYYGNGVDDPSFYPYSQLGQVLITYEYTDGNGCTSDDTAEITVIDSVTVTPDSVHLCLDGPGAQFTTIPVNAVWASDYVTPGGTVLTDDAYTGYAPCYFTDVLGCDAPGTGYVDVEYPNDGYAYVGGGESDDILCLDEAPTTITYTLANGTIETIDFDPAVYGIGSFQFIGFGDVSEFDCAINDTLIVQVVAPPDVTLAPFADTLVSGCQNSTYLLTGGLPTGGYYYGNGVDDPSFYPYSQLGQVAITYEYTDGNGCTSYATEEITVIDSVEVTPDSVHLCLDGPGAQFTTIPVNAVWASDYVMPDGTVPTDLAFTGYAVCFFTDVLGCQAPGTGYVDVENPNYGYAYVNDGNEDDILCSNGVPVTITRSLPDGTQETVPFDPAIAGVGTYTFIGYGDVSEFDCAINDTLIVQVVAPPIVTLEPFADILASGCGSGYPLTGGLPTGGYYDGDGVDGDFLYPFALLGQVPVTYYYTDGNGCTNYDTEEITVIDAISAVPDAVATCPGTDPVQLASVPSGALWSGSTYVTSGGSLDVSMPNSEAAIGTWTDVVGCTLTVAVPVDVYDYTYGNVEVVGYDEPVSLCVNTPPVDVLASQADGSILTTSFAPSQGAGTYEITGYGPTAANCPVDVTLTITVNNIPAVSLAPFTDTLVAGCSGGYVLTGGLPASGYYDGPGVDGDFFPFAQSGQVPITYQYTDVNGCTAYDTEDITVIDAITAVPDAVATCPDTDPVQLASVPPGAIWSGSTYVTTGGSLDVSTPNNEAAIGTWTDVIGCAVQVTVPVDVYDYTYGTVEVVGYAEPVSLCVNTPPVDVLASQADGSILTTSFDPSQGAGTYDITGFGPTAANCPVDVTLTITVHDIPAVSLAPFTDTLVAGCSGGYVLTGGLPAGGYYDGPGVDGDFFPFGQSGQVPITYQYTDVNGCTAYDTEDITVIDAITAVPDAVATCPDTDPVQLTSVPPGAVWSGSTYATAGGSLDVSTPNNEAAIGTWTDVIGCAVDVTVPVDVYDYTYGTVEVVGYPEPVALCTNNAPVNVLTSQPDGTTLNVPFDPSIAAPGEYAFVGYGPDAANCPLNDTLIITVHAIPNVALASFTDTLVNVCPNAYSLTSGIPAGGVYSGTGVNGDFFPEGLSGQVDITYTYTDGNGCANYATEAITVIDAITAVPDAVATCPDTDPVQLASVPPGAVWSGSTYVTPGGSLDVSTPNNEAAIGTWTDVIGCALEVTVPISVFDYTYGTVEVVGYDEPVSLCVNTPPVDVLASQADGSILTTSFDPSQGAGTYDIIGFGPTAANCPVDVTLTITVNDIPTVTLDPFTDTLVNVCPNAYSLTSGLPAGGVYSGTGVNGDFFPEGLSGQVEVMYTYTDGNGCTNYATEAITVIDALVPTIATVTTCPDTDPVQLASAPPGAAWSGSPNVTPAGLLDVSTPYTADIIGTWTDVTGCAVEVTVPVTVYDYTYGMVEVLGYSEPVSLCVNTPPVTVETSQPDGSILSETFDPSSGANTYDFTGYAPTSANCPVDVTLTITVTDIPTVTLDPFTDTLVNVCTNAYALNSGLPVGGTYSGTGVNSDFFPEGLLGQVDITYSYTDANGCSNDATQAITVIGQVDPTPTSVTTCADVDPVQLQSDPPGAAWSGSPNVTPDGSLDVSTPYSADIIGTWTDVTGCALQTTVPVTVNGTDPGYAYVVGLPAPVVLCESAAPVTIITSLAAGGEDSFPFDPAAQGPGQYTYTGFAPGSSPCPVDVTLTIDVVGSPAVSLALPYDELCSGSIVALSGGLPAGGVFTNYNGSGDQMDIVDGANAATYQYTDVNGCSGSATDQAIGVSVTEANGYDTSTPVLCPSDAPLVFEPSPLNGTWSGVMTDEVFDPYTDTGGAWAYTITDDAGNTCGISGMITALPYTEASLDASATTVCVSSAPVQVFGTNALGGTIVGPILPDDPFDPFNPSGTFDPAVGIGEYVFSMDVDGDAQGCAWYLELTVTVVAVPNVTVSAFTDTLLNICETSVYTLTQGSPAGGTWSGPGVTDDGFSAFGLIGPQTLTYTYSLGADCEGSATGVIEVVPDVPASPYNSQVPLFACEDSDPVQLTTVPSGADWTGAAVTPQGFVDMSNPYNGPLTYVFTDATGCEYTDGLQAVISPYSMGYVDIQAPGATQVCGNTAPFEVHLSTAEGVDSIYYFDPAVEGPGIHPFTGVAPLQTDPPGCYQDAVLTIQVLDTVELQLGDDWTLDTEGSFTLTGGQPSGGTYSGTGVTDNVFSPADALPGENIITYTITSGPCPGSATDTLWVSTVGFADLDAGHALQVWPVPTRDELFISMPGDRDNVTLTLVDAGGREVARRTTTGNANGTPLRWDIGSLANGSYTLWTTGLGNISPARVVIAH